MLLILEGCIENNSFEDNSKLNDEIYLVCTETVGFEWNYYLFRDLRYYKGLETKKNIEEFIENMSNQVNENFQLPKDGVLFRNDSTRTNVNLRNYIESYIVTIHDNKTGKIISENIVIGKVNLDEIDILNKEHEFRRSKSHEEDAYYNSQSWIADFKILEKLYSSCYYECTKMYNQELSVEIHIFGIDPKLVKRKK